MIRTYSGNAARENLQARGRRCVVRNEEPHWQHVGLEETVALKEILRAQLRPIGQQGDPEELFLFRKLDGVLEETRAIAVAAESIVNHEIFEKENEPTLRGADREKEVDHANDRPIAPQDEDPAAVRLFKNQAQSLELLLFVRAQILLLAEELAEQV